MNPPMKARNLLHALGKIRKGILLGKKKGRTLVREDPESRGVWAEERLKEGGRPGGPTTGPGGSFPGSVVWLRR